MPKKKAEEEIIEEETEEKKEVSSIRLVTSEQLIFNELSLIHKKLDDIIKLAEEN